MARYQVKVVHEALNGMANGTNRNPMVKDVVAPSADVAIERAIYLFRMEGYDGTFRWPEAVNTEDAHDTARRSW